ncbi:hypothetical protein HK102_003310 [Quaeritorhiza haematococci]|nr:hypothetical protein HK102_003310 [Quaeritorhiza haematococci]
MLLLPPSTSPPNVDDNPTIPDLQTASLDGSIFLKRAEAHRNLGHYDQAFTDIRTAISLDRGNPAAVKAMHALLEHVAAEDTDRGSVKKLLVLACDAVSVVSASGGEGGEEKKDGETATTTTTTTTKGSKKKQMPTRSPAQRFESAQRLVVLSKDADVARRIGKEGGIELLLPAFLAEREREGEKGPPSLQYALLRIVANLAAVPEHTMQVLQYFVVEPAGDSGFFDLAALSKGATPAQALMALKSPTMGDWDKYETPAIVAKFLGEKDAKSYVLAVETLSTLIIQAQQSSSAGAAAALLDTRWKRLSVGVLRHLSKMIRERFEAVSGGDSNAKQDAEDIIFASLHGIIKVLNDRDTAVWYLKSDEFVTVLKLSNASSNAVKNLVPVVLTRLFDKIDDMEPSGKTKNKKSGEDLVREQCYAYITRWMDFDDKSAKSRALLVLAAIFQARPSAGSGLLMKEGMMTEIMDVIEFEPDHVQLATVEALSSACADKTCRTLIAARCSEFLLKLASSSNALLRSAASAALIKVMSEDKDLEKRMLSNDRITDSFTSIINSSSAAAASSSPAPLTASGGKAGSNSLLINSLEALAYLTLHPPVKEKIAFDPSLLKSLFSLAKGEDRSIQYGVATILMNITSYRKRLSEEEEQLKKLKEMAGEIVSKPDPLDDDSRVERRAAAVTNAGAVPTLVALAKTESANIREVVCRVFLNLVWDKNNRGKVIQQGGAKALVTLSNNRNLNPEAVACAAQALAKIAITTDPNLAFKGQRAAELVRPLIALCNGEGQLRQFEALMALTNLASMDDTVRTRIIQAKGLKAMEMLQFSDNEMIRRAATEALCNMMYEPSVFKSYAEGASASSRLRIFIALSDVEDFETRRAASGALAILSSSDEVCEVIAAEWDTSSELAPSADPADDDDEKRKDGGDAKKEGSDTTKETTVVLRNSGASPQTQQTATTTHRGMEVVMSLISSDEKNPEILHRGVEIIKNLCRASVETARQVVLHGGVPALTALLSCEYEAVAQGALEALMYLRQHVNTGGLQA